MKQLLTINKSNRKSEIWKYNFWDKVMRKNL